MRIGAKAFANQNIIKKRWIQAKGFFVPLHQCDLRIKSYSNVSRWTNDFDF